MVVIPVKGLGLFWYSSAERWVISVASISIVGSSKPSNYSVGGAVAEREVDEEVGTPLSITTTLPSLATIEVISTLSDPVIVTFPPLLTVMFCTFISHPLIAWVPETD
jgi:hypothetical protein